MNRHDEKVIASARKQRALFDELEKALAEELNALDRPSTPPATPESSPQAADPAEKREAEFNARLESLIAEFGLDRETAHAWLCDLSEFQTQTD